MKRLMLLVVAAIFLILAGGCSKIENGPFGQGVALSPQASSGTEESAPAAPSGGPISGPPGQRIGGGSGGPTDYPW